MHTMETYLIPNLTVITVTTAVTDTRPALRIPDWRRFLYRPMNK